MPAVGAPAELTKRQVTVFSLLCCLVYGASYLTRYNYMASVSAIKDALQVSNQLAGMAVIGSFIAYGIGQPIFGVLGDRLHPRILIFGGLLASSLCNAAVSFMNDIAAMTVVWCFNGFFQSMLWPPLVRIMSQTLTREHYRKTSIGVVTAASIGTIAVYLLVPLCIAVSSWRMSFAIPSLVGLAVAIVWLIGIKRFGHYVKVGERESENLSEETKEAVRDVEAPGLRTLFAASGIVPILLAVVCQGALRDGITTWMPSYIQDVYRIDTSISILTTVVLPIFSILSVSVAAHVQHYVANELKTAAYIWAVGLAATLALVMVFDSNAIWSVLFMAILTGCAHGINLMLISHVPIHFAKYRKVSTVSGLVNAFAYAGSSVSIYGIAALSDWYSWRVIILVWALIGLLGLLVSLLCIGKWGTFTRLSQNAYHNSPQ